MPNSITTDRTKTSHLLDSLGAIERHLAKRIAEVIEEDASRSEHLTIERLAERLDVDLDRTSDFPSFVFMAASRRALASAGYVTDDDDVLDDYDDDPEEF
jgi:hypothetical protein